MAVLISRADGDWTAAATWALVNAASYLNAEISALSSLVVAYGVGQTFTPGAITIDAIAVKLAARAANPTGTVSVALDQGGSTVANTEVTINVADLPAAVTASADGGWIVFKFSTSVTLAAATLYAVKAKSSNTVQVFLWRDATVGNWSRMLRTTATQAPVAGDVLVVAGEHTGAGTGNDIVVTMNSTATTDYGTAPTAANSLVEPGASVSRRGTLSYGTAAATNYYLKVSSSVIVYRGGTLNIGTTGVPIPRNSTAVLEFDPGIDGDYGLLIRNGTLNIQGQSRTSGKDVVWCLLNANEAINSISLDVDTDTGWLDNDQIAVASTTRTAAQSELGALNGNAGAASLTVDGFAGAGGGLAFAHDGIAPTQAEVINITRNVKVRSATSTLMAYVYCAAEAIVDIDWAEFYYLGENATNKRGIEIYTTALGAFDMQFSSIHSCEDGGFYATGSAGSGWVFSNNVMWNLASVTATAWFVALATTGTWTASNNIMIKAAFGPCFNLGDIGGTFTNNRAVSATTVGFNVNEFAAALGTFSGNSAHSCTTSGLQFNAPTTSGAVTNYTGWRNSAYGIIFNDNIKDIVIEGATVFGNANANVASIVGSQSVWLKSLMSDSETAFPTTNGFVFFGQAVTCNFIIDDSEFSSGSGMPPHGGDIAIGADVDVRMLVRNTKFNGGSHVSGANLLGLYGSISSQKHDQTAGDHRTWMKYGMVQTDGTIFNAASPSMRMVPTNASSKLESAPHGKGIKVPVEDGGTVTVSVYTRKSVVGDGAAYNGNQPRLILRENLAIGIFVDEVLDTHSVAAGSWEQLSGTTSAASGDDGVMEFIVDCDGTAGFVNVDDWAVS